jgi:predicted nucleic acid-binding protein
MMIITDSSALIALLNAEDPAHARCAEALQFLPAQPLLITVPSFVEAMYFLGKLGGFALQNHLWTLWTHGKIAIHCPSDAELQRMRTLMEKYADIPMDFADASIVAAAESLGVDTVFTIDSDFYIYRLYDKRPFNVIP